MSLSIGAFEPRPGRSLRLTIDVTEKTLDFGDGPVATRHRWEALWLATLVSGHDAASRACHGAAFNDRLAAHGQRVPLNRKQVSRLIDSLAERFALGGHDLDERLRHSSRQRTVGPWWWEARPDDEVRVVGMGAVAETQTLRVAPATTVSRRLLASAPVPQMSSEPGLAALIGACRLVLSFQPTWEGGPYAAVLPALSQARSWRDASPELVAMRWLLTTSSHLHTRRLVDGQAALAQAQAILERSAIARTYLGSWARTLRLGLARIDAEDDRRRAAALELDAWLSGTDGGGPEVDRLSRLFLFGFAALSEVQALRRQLERHAQSNPRRHADLAIRLYSASLFCAFSGRHFDHLVSVLAHVGNLAHTMLEAGLESDVKLPLECFVLGNQAMNKLALIDATGLIGAGLGNCWLSLPAARRAFDALATQRRWAGPRPHELAFYTQNRDETRHWGDPRYQGKALLNLMRFCAEFGPAAEGRRAAQEWQRLQQSSPGLAEVLRAEGWAAA